MEDDTVADFLDMTIRRRKSKSTGSGWKIVLIVIVIIIVVVLAIGVLACMWCKKRKCSLIDDIRNPHNQIDAVGSDETSSYHHGTISGSGTRLDRDSVSDTFRGVTPGIV